MNLYLKFDAGETRSSKLGCLMVLDTRKCSKFDAPTLLMPEKKVLEVSLAQKLVINKKSSIFIQQL